MTEMARDWRVEMEPKGLNPVGDDGDHEEKEGGENRSGVVIYLVSDAERKKEEVSRVSFIRRNSKNPRTSFKRQLKAELSKAWTTAETLNGKMADMEEAKEKAIAEAEALRAQVLSGAAANRDV